MHASKAHEASSALQKPMSNVLYICNFDLFNYTTVRRPGMDTGYSETNSATVDAMNNTVGRITTAFGPGKNCQFMPIYQSAEDRQTYPDFHRWYYELTNVASVPPGRLTVYLTTEEQLIWCQLAF